MTTKKRLKVYGIALPIFLILSLVLGAFAQLGGEMYRDSYWKSGWIDGANFAYTVGWQQGLEAGVITGRINGFMEGYKKGVFAWDNIYHAAALGFEEKYTWCDITLLVGNENMIALALLLPNENPPGFDGEAWNNDLVSLLESVWDGQPIVRVFIVQYIPTYGALYLVSLIDFDAVTLFEYKLGEGTEGQYLIYYPELCPEFLLEWPSNPYWAPASDADAAQLEGT